METDNGRLPGSTILKLGLHRVFSALCVRLITRSIELDCTLPNLGVIIGEIFPDRPAEAAISGYDEVEQTLHDLRSLKLDHEGDRAWLAASLRRLEEFEVVLVKAGQGDIAATAQIPELFRQIADDDQLTPGVVSLITSRSGAVAENSGLHG